MDDAKERGLRAFARRAWSDAYEGLSRAAEEGPLDLGDLERLAVSAGLSGNDEAAFEAYERLYQQCLDADQPCGAARAAFWAAMRSFAFGERARASGWVARAKRLVDRLEADCAEQGYVRLPDVLGLLAAGDFARAEAASREVAELAIRHGDRDLAALARSFEARALIRHGRFSDGLAVFDETMVAVMSGELSPVVTGVVYCAAIAACQQSHAHDRSREWTEALSRWCEAQPQLVAFTKQCLIHRSEVLLLTGAWPEAAKEIQRATDAFAKKGGPDAGHAFYQEAEIHRLRGAESEAERAYAAASEHGRDPQPGLALLRLAQGRVDVAAATSRRVLSTVTGPLDRARFLPAHVEIMVAACDLDEAHRAAMELTAIAERLDVEIVGALARHAKGAVALARGDARAAIEPLREAQDVWQRAGAPYLVARIRLAVARAFQLLGDHDGAALEVDAAKNVFVKLGAAPDVAASDSIAAIPEPGESGAQDMHGLSAREVEVLRLVATGKTNKVIARELFLSERTVDRHVSNIFGKLNVATRAAATAWAFQNGLAG